MPKYGRFAVSFLSVVLIAAGAHAADLRDMKTPETIPSVFPAKARLRLLAVWATWCIPCVEEMPDLVAIDKTFGSELAIAGVSLDDMLPDWFCSRRRHSPPIWISARKCRRSR